MKDSHDEKVSKVDEGHSEDQDMVREGNQQQAAPLELTEKIKFLKCKV